MASETVNLSTVQLQDGTMLFMIGVAPQNEARVYLNTFSRVRQSLQFSRTAVRYESGRVAPARHQLSEREIKRLGSLVAGSTTSNGRCCRGCRMNGSIRTTGIAHASSVE